MLKKRLITVLTFNDGVLFRTKNFTPDYRYTLNYVNNSYIDEIVILDVTRKSKLKKNFFKIVERFAEKCFVPISVGGGIRDITDVKNLMNSGADKVVLNTGAIENNILIKDISKSYGKQCVVLSVDTKKQKNKYTVMSNNGKIDTKLNIENWVKKAINLGAGEIILNTVEKDGSLEGFDLKLARRISKISSVPVLIVGGAGNWQHFEEGLKTGVAGVCTQNIFHYTETSILSAKSYLLKKKIDIRK